MRRCIYLIFGLVVIGGCSWGNFWYVVADSVNGSSYRNDGTLSRAADFQDNYEQQSKAAQEYYQNH